MRITLLTTLAAAMFAAFLCLAYEAGRQAELMHYARSTAPR